MPDHTPPAEPFRFTDADGDYLHIGIPHTPASGGPAVSFHTATEPVHVPVERIEELITALRRLAGGTTAVEPIALPARWECSHGPSDDEPYCAAEDGHVCPTIRVHPSDAPAFAALVDEVHRLKGELAGAQEDVAWLRCLEAAGVDNWEGYDGAIEMRGE